MRIKLVVVGKLKEKYWREAAGEYLKRLAPFARVEIIEIAEEKLPDNPSAKEMEQALNREGERILNHISPSFYVIPLAITGQMLSSEQLAEMLGRLAMEGKSRVVFIIGGSCGLAEEVIERGDLVLSFSPLTFPHQMMRVLLLEQIYRGFKILRGEPYHK
ncbi:MAG: 23S rRNA (pseudouridine(1915)-N(3))-methyltransferase RlmH [Peptococcaceae bacterium]|jgi:23S rRNA (pseudouridine1915-N3)-methyltransferase|nr:23S rRNA (pseudouridine(1915)-N(3))-methyltransferase RlmH [Peptococcaceae bacterium]MDH7523770.1 23S rRNA (pseudouridine(1915)-N(3))-methyltransferase RlmH [Peptococcaceae bacterium]